MLSNFIIINIPKAKKYSVDQHFRHSFVPDNSVDFQEKHAFDSIAGNTVVAYRSLKKFFSYHRFFAIYNISVK